MSQLFSPPFNSNCCHIGFAQVALTGVLQSTFNFRGGIYTCGSTYCKRYSYILVWFNAVVLRIGLILHMFIVLRIWSTQKAENRLSTQAIRWIGVCRCRRLACFETSQFLVRDYLPDRPEMFTLRSSTSLLSITHLPNQQAKWMWASIVAFRAQWKTPNDPYCTLRHVWNVLVMASSFALIW